MKEDELMQQRLEGIFEVGAGRMGGVGERVTEVRVGRGLMPQYGARLTPATLRAVRAVARSSSR